MSLSDFDGDVQEQLGELVERCKEVALMVGEGKEVFAECAYCHQPVPLWEALFTQQLSGVLAHLSCPDDALAKVMGDAGPNTDFDFKEFADAVDARMANSPTLEAATGEIDVPSD